MKIGVAILCRYNSTRFPGKILAEIRGRSVLGVIARRIGSHAPELPLAVATSTEPSDNIIEKECNRLGVKCFRGSLDNVARRLLDCARENDWDYVVRINGDNLFADFESLHAMLAVTKSGAYDLVTNVCGRTFPAGMSVEILRTRLLASRIAEFTKSEEEHVTSYFYRREQAHRVYVYKNERYPEASKLNLAIDTPHDLKRAEEIAASASMPVERLGLEEILKTCQSNPGLWDGTRCLLIAEIGGNHEGNFEYAKKLCREAIDSGADCIKFQIYTGDSLVNATEDRQRNHHFKKFELSPAQHIELAEMCRNNGRMYSASVWDPGALAWIDAYIDFYKIGSGDLTCWPMIKEFAERGKPIVLSTGLATLEEVAQTVNYIRNVNSSYNQRGMLCVLQCTSMYPIPDAEANINCMSEIKDLLSCSVGYSDHTIGMKAIKYAVAKGAQVIEYHFTDAREGKEFRDHAVSLTKDETVELIQEIRSIHAICGDGIKKPQASEIENGHLKSFRRSVYTHVDVPQGRRITFEDLVYLRPLQGTDPRDVGRIVGGRASLNIKAHEPLVEDQNYECS